MMPSAGAVSQAGSRIRGRDVRAGAPAIPDGRTRSIRGVPVHPGSYHSAGLIGQTRWFSATMGCMSASDAAPLPRLGEVFFDVRGNSRSMRLSWYADTGVAVFSIWQGGTCTGTFRLPMDDLARMIESLQRGPQGQRAGRREAPGRGRPPGRRAARRRRRPAGRGPDEGQATMAMRMPAGSGAPSGPAPGRLPRPATRQRPERAAGLPAGTPADTPSTRSTRPIRSRPARYPDEPSTGSYRRPAQEYGPGATAGGTARAATRTSPGTAGRRPDYRRPGTGPPGYQDVPATGDYRGGRSGSHRRDPGDLPGPGYPKTRATRRAQVRRRPYRAGVCRGRRPRRVPRPG